MILRSARSGVGGELVRPSYGQGRYGVVPPRAQNIAATSALQTLSPLHTIGRVHPRRLLPNAASVEEQGDDHCGSESCRYAQSWLRMLRSDYQGDTCTPPSAARVGCEGATGTADEISPCSWLECVVWLSLCSTLFSLVVS